MRRFILVLAAGLAVAATMPDAAAAQGRGNGRGNGRGVANGPAFCRSGAGHPVFGRAWCVDKGFALGSQDWRRMDIGRVILPRSNGHGRVERGGLLDILGDVVFGRLESQRTHLHVDDALSGIWLTPPEGPRVLQVWAGDTPLGELVDNDRNGSVDLFVLRFGN
jgi:hypothetical protein